MIRRTIAIPESGAGSGPALPSSILLVLALVTVAAGGCVRRVVEITSEPAGALVWMNDREVGTTPCEVEILHYGTYDVRVVKPGFEPFVGARRADAPAWDLPGPDLVAELVPAEFESRNRWHVDLVVEDMSPEAVIQRALVARDDLAALERTEPVDPDLGKASDLESRIRELDEPGLEPERSTGGDADPGSG
ncbi:MAG: PEGA domain-containing protein [Planctomycetota bacterium]|nr:PEGA domain-containing protein [Planctomycetota bacterium]